MWFGGATPTQQLARISDLSPLHEATLLFKTDFYVAVPFTELKLKKHQVQCEEGRGSR
jgi:hypothetical protein